MIIQVAFLIGSDTYFLICRRPYGELWNRLSVSCQKSKIWPARLWRKLRIRKRNFPSSIKTSAEEKIRQIRVQLEQNQKTQLADLKKRTQEGFAQMEDYYEKQHQRLAREIYEKIIQT